MVLISQALIWVYVDYAMLVVFAMVMVCLGAQFCKLALLYVEMGLLDKTNNVMITIQSLMMVVLLFVYNNVISFALVSLLFVIKHYLLKHNLFQSGNQAAMSFKLHRKSLISI